MYLSKKDPAKNNLRLKNVFEMATVHDISKTMQLSYHLTTVFRQYKAFKREKYKALKMESIQCLAAQQGFVRECSRSANEKYITFTPRIGAIIGNHPGSQNTFLQLSTGKIDTFLQLSTSKINTFLQLSTRKINTFLQLSTGKINTFLQLSTSKMFGGYLWRIFPLHCLLL